MEKILEMSQTQDFVTMGYCHSHLAGDRKVAESCIKQVPLGKNFLKKTLVASKLATERNQKLVKEKSLT